MSSLRAALATLSLIVCAHTPGFAQTTAGSATTIVVPVTAQTTTFTSEITVYNPNGVTINVDVAFYEANNSATPGLRTCTDAVVPANRSAQFSLATQCTLSAASHFGLLVLTDLSGTHPFYGYVRTQNTAGAGFSTEGFPAGNFNDQVSHSTGLKKTTTGLIYQTNCFVGSLAQPVSYTLKLFNDTTGAQIGSTIAGSLAAFQQLRYLDIFGPAGVNAPNVNQMNVRAEFTPTTMATLIGFCTVQDNTSFGADFRIAKSYGSPNVYVQGGNAFGTLANNTAILGTTDGNALDIRVNGARVMRYEPAFTPNVIGGHPGNAVTPGAFGASIGGGGGPGSTNRVTDVFGTVAGGYGNQAGDAAASLFNASFATVGGGANNTASGIGSTVGGGDQNIANGDYAVVPGGFGNVAQGVGSFAAGSVARSFANGCFTWADDSSNNPYDCTGANAFTARAAGGVYFRTNAAATSGVNLLAGASAWSTISDRAAKHHFVAVDGQDVLERLSQVPISTWNYRSQDDAIRHMGPMAQDLYEAFGLGESDKHISTIDADGIALAAIQGLHTLVQEQAREITELKSQLAIVNERSARTELLQAEMMAMKAALSELQGARARLSASGGSHANATWQRPGL